jgi:hypothetical protein
LRRKLISFCFRFPLANHSPASSTIIESRKTAAH